MSIKIDDISNEIAKALTSYTEDVGKAIEEEIVSTSKKVLAEVRDKAPRRTGKYAKGFKMKKDDSKSSVNRIIYNKDKPGLVHLMELGYAKRGGQGRVEGRPHLSPAYDNHVPAMEKRIENIIKKGGKK